MTTRILILFVGMAVLPGMPGVAHGQVSAQPAALLADWSDGTSGNVSINERGSNVLRAYHVTRRGTRLTIFDRVERQYRTFHVSRSGTVVTVWDPSSGSRESYVARGRGSVVSLVNAQAGAYRRFVRRSTGTTAGATNSASAHAAGQSRVRSDSRRFRDRIRALDRTLSEVKTGITSTDVVILSVVTDP